MMLKVKNPCVLENIFLLYYLVTHLICAKNGNQFCTTIRNILVLSILLLAKRAINMWGAMEK